MGNRIYLYCTDFDHVPNDTEWEHFFTVSGTEYEAQGHLPFLWLALFDETSVKIDPGNRNGFYEDERAYAYLIDRKEKCVSRMKRLYALVSDQQECDVVRKMAEWIERIQSEPRKNVIVRTEELDWMGEEGALEQELRKALRHLDEALSRSEVRFSNAIRALCGLSEIDELLSSKPSWLLGGANGSTQWPETQTPEFSSPQPTSKKKKTWWQLW